MGLLEDVAEEDGELLSEALVPDGAVFSLLAAEEEVVIPDAFIAILEDAFLLTPAMAAEAGDRAELPGAVPGVAFPGPEFAPYTFFLRLTPELERRLVPVFVALAAVAAPELAASKEGPAPTPMPDGRVTPIPALAAATCLRSH